MPLSCTTSEPMHLSDAKATYAHNKRSWRPTVNHWVDVLGNQSISQTNKQTIILFLSAASQTSQPSQ